jgi:hypothetical protein
MKRVPTEFFSGNHDLSAGERSEAYLTIAAALGMAAVVEAKRSGFFDDYRTEIDEVIQNFSTLNIMNMMETGKSFVHELEHKGLREEEQMIQDELEDIFGLDPSTALISSKVFGAALNSIYPLHSSPMVGDNHLQDRINEFYDAWQFVIGFKDGVFLVTGNNSKFE